MAKLKVYRTPAGFHDAYVAAPSQKAALKAWGSDANLFARGIAEVVTDPALTKAPLAAPGEVIRVARTSADELPTPTLRPKKRAAKPAAEPKPRPSRAALEAAERALEDAEARHAEEQRALRREEEALVERRREMEKAQAAERLMLDRARLAARDDYQAAVEAWNG